LRDWRTAKSTHGPKLLDLLSFWQEPESEAALNHLRYRFAGHQRMLHQTSSGVASNSVHMVGQAIDIRVADRRLDKLRDIPRWR